MAPWLLLLSMVLLIDRFSPKDNIELDEWGEPTKKIIEKSDKFFL